MSSGRVDEETESSAFQRVIAVRGEVLETVWSKYGGEILKMYRIAVIIKGEPRDAQRLRGEIRYVIR